MDTVSIIVAFLVIPVIISVAIFQLWRFDKKLEADLSRMTKKERKAWAINTIYTGRK